MAVGTFQGRCQTVLHFINDTVILPKCLNTLNSTTGSNDRETAGASEGKWDSQNNKVHIGSSVKPDLRSLRATFICKRYNCCLFQVMADGNNLFYYYHDMYCNLYRLHYTLTLGTYPTNIIKCSSNILLLLYLYYYVDIFLFTSIIQTFISYYTV